MSGPAQDLKRSQRSMIVVRWVGAAFAALQVVIYDNRPYPSPAYRNMGLALAAFLAVGNLGIFASMRRVSTLNQARIVALAGIALDVAVAHAFVWLFTFDQLSALWTVLFIIPLEGAIMFQLSGALATWAIGTGIYIAREIWGAATYPEGYPIGVQWSSVSFRMGIGLLIAMVAGLMARDLTRQRGQLRVALTEVQRVDRMRSALVSTLAHDVRNPLTAIRGALSVVRKHAGTVEPAVASELLGNADHQAERLERLASDLLDLARLERGRLELKLEDVELRNLVTEALSFADRNGEYEVRVGPDLIVRADPGRLEQVVVNLASNALRYGEPPFVVAAHTEDGVVSLELRDHGPGVAPEDAEQLFEPFRTEPDSGSVGFGLAIVKALAEAHGGGVSYEPNEPQGACFIVRLPLAGPA